MIEEHRISLAEAEVDQARERLLTTIGELADRMEPKKIMTEVWETAKVKSADLVEDAVDAVRSRPLLAGGALAAVIGFLAREPIADAASRAYGAMKSKSSKKQAKLESAKPASPKPTKARTRTPRKMEKSQ